MAEAIIKGQTLYYEESVRQQIIENLETTHPDMDLTDINLLDVATFLAANAYHAPNTKIKLILDGMEMLFDGTTNSLSSSEQSIESWMRGFTSAVVGGIAGIVVGSRVHPLLGFAFGNATQNWFNNEIWDPIIGASYNVVYNIGSDNDGFPLRLKSDSTIENTVADAEARADMKALFNGTYSEFGKTNVKLIFNNAQFEYRIKDEDGDFLDHGNRIDITYSNDKISRGQGLIIAENYIVSFVNSQALTPVLLCFT